MSDLAEVLTCYGIFFFLLALEAWLLTRRREKEQVPFSSMGE